MIKSKLYLLLTGLAFISAVVCNAQEPNPSNQNIEAHHEVKQDKYLPNAHNNKKVAPPYKFQDWQTSKKSSSIIFTTQVNVDANGSNIIGDAANEPSIAVNPLNGDQIVIGWRQFDNVTSNFRQAGWAYTNDAGQSWTFPGVIEPGIFRSDPVLDFDNNGNFYYNSLTVDSLNNFSCDVFKSINGGESWDDGVFAFGGDKQWMAIDRSDGIGSGNIYAFWNSFYTVCPPDYFTRSTDAGVSYETCTFPQGNPYWGTMVVDNSGVVYLCGRQNVPGSLVFTKSEDAQIPGATMTWNSVTVFMDGTLTGSDGVNPSGLLGQADIDVDHSSTPGLENVYLLASVERLNTYDDLGDVMFARSTDDGLTWELPIRVNDDLSTDNTQWFGTMSVAPNGRIDAIWLDTRDSPLGSDNSSLYYSFSEDGGISWSENEMLSPLFDPHVGYPNQNKLGDYFDMVSDNIGAHLAWANTLNGEQDVYYSFIMPNTATGVNDLSINHSFSILPNPVSTILTIKSTNVKLLEIFSAVGEKVHEAKINSQNSVSTEIDVSSWTDGLYIVKGGNDVKKFIKTSVERK